MLAHIALLLHFCLSLLEEPYHHVRNADGTYDSSFNLVSIEQQIAKNTPQIVKCGLASLMDRMGRAARATPQGNSVADLLINSIREVLDTRALLALRRSDPKFSGYWNNLAREAPLELFFLELSFETLLFGSVREGLRMALHSLCSVLDDKKTALIIQKLTTFDEWTTEKSPGTETAPGFTTPLTAAQLFRAGERVVKEVLEEDRPLILPSFLREDERKPRPPGKLGAKTGGTPRGAREEVPLCRNHARGYPCSIQPCPFGPPGHKSIKAECNRGGQERSYVAVHHTRTRSTQSVECASSRGQPVQSSECASSRGQPIQSAECASSQGQSNECASSSETSTPHSEVSQNLPRLHLYANGEWTHAFTSTHKIDPYGPCVIFDTGATGDGMLLVPNPADWGQTCEAVRVNTANGSALIERRASIKIDVARGRYMKLQPLVAPAAVRHPVLLVPGHRLRSCHLTTDGIYIYARNRRRLFPVFAGLKLYNKDHARVLDVHRTPINDAVSAAVLVSLITQCCSLTNRLRDRDPDTLSDCSTAPDDAALLGDDPCSDDDEAADPHPDELPRDPELQLSADEAIRNATLISILTTVASQANEIDTSVFPTQQRAKLTAAIQRHARCFRTDLRNTADWSPKHFYKFEIRPGAEPRRFARTKLNPIREGLRQRAITQLLEQDIIERADGASDWCSRSGMPRKPHADDSADPLEQHRFVVDLKYVNDCTVTDHFAPPNPERLFHEAQESTCFSKLDITRSFFNLGVPVESRKFTTFDGGPTGLYRFKRMPLGAKNATAAWQRMMQNILGDLPGVVVYVDDILIHSATHEEHADTICEVLRRLDENCLAVKARKCEFFQNKIAFLGFLLSNKGLEPLPDLVDKMRRFPRPTSIKGVKSFLGLVNFYARFIRNFAHYTAPLHELTKSSKLVWTPDADAAFNKIKDLICSADVLVKPDWSKPFRITTDASDRAIGAVLEQLHDGEWRPVAFYSSKLNDAQRKYAPTVKELLAVKCAVAKFEYFILGNRCTIRTDHKPLVDFSKKHTFESNDDKQWRWWTYLQDFDLEFEYVKGEDNVVADCLSRPDDEDDEIKTTDAIDSAFLNFSLQQALWAMPAITASTRQRMLDAGWTERPHRSGNTVWFSPTGRRFMSHSDAADAFRRSPAGRAVPVQRTAPPREPTPPRMADPSGTSPAAQPADRAAPVQPAPAQHDTCHSPDAPSRSASPGAQPASESAASQSSAPSSQTTSVARPAFKERVKQAQLLDPDLSLQAAGEYAELNITIDANGFRTFDNRIIVPASMREETLHGFHALPGEGHPWHRPLVSLISSEYWWPTLETDAERFVRNCEACATNSTHHEHTHNAPSLAPAPYHTLQLDIIHMPRAQGYSYALSVVCVATRKAWTIPLRSVCAEDVIDALISRVFSESGIPLVLQADGGSAFRSALFARLCERLNISQRTAPPDAHWVQGIVERYNRTIKGHIRKLLHTCKGEWPSLLPIATMAYNAASHEALVVDGRKVSPHEVLTGQQMRTPRHLLGYGDLTEPQAALIRDIFYSASRQRARSAVPQDHVTRSLPSSAADPHKFLGLDAAVRVRNRRSATDHKVEKSLTDKYTALGRITKLYAPAVGSSVCKVYDVTVSGRVYKRIHRDFLKHEPEHTGVTFNTYSQPTRPASTRRPPHAPKPRDDPALISMHEAMARLKAQEHDQYLDAVAAREQWQPENA